MPPEPQPPRSDQLRELLGLALLILGAAALVVPAFATDWRLGCALLGAAFVAGGIRLTVKEA